MNNQIIPAILNDESLFDPCAFDAANHVARQSESIRSAIAHHGELLEKGQPIEREDLITFYRNLCRARVDMWTDQLEGWPDDQARLENTIARNVYLAQAALSE